MSEFNLFKCSSFLNSFELAYLETERNLHLSLRLLCLQTAAKQKTIVANVNKRTVTTSGSQRHCVT